MEPSRRQTQEFVFEKVTVEGLLSFRGPRRTDERIHSSDGPVSDHHSQEGEGQQRVEQRRHNMGDRSDERNVTLF